jgi:hypothetical protein
MFPLLRIWQESRQGLLVVWVTSVGQEPWAGLVLERAWSVNTTYCINSCDEGIPWVKPILESSGWSLTTLPRLPDAAKPIVQVVATGG